MGRRRTGVSVLAAIMSPKRVVLVKDPSARDPLYWKLPGGGMEEGETPRAAIARETKEETGIDVHEERFSPLVTRDKGTHAQHLFFARITEREMNSHAQHGKDGEKVGVFEIKDWDALEDFHPQHRLLIKGLDK